MKIAYEDWNPNQKSLDHVTQAEQIINEYRAAGYTLTLRQLYYQFVARGIVENTERSYKNLGNTITKARMAGLISWQAIEDRNRGHVRPYTEEDDEMLVGRLQHSIVFDQWARQENYVEVWVEKEALGNVIARACNPFDVPYLSCKGYLSASEAWRAGRRMLRRSDKSCHIIHLGDHDPSGIDMTRDNDERVKLFGEFGDITVHRIALNMDQIEDQGPPPNPTKLSDSRAGDYIAKHGYESWELDALEPSFIEKIIADAIEPLIDRDVWAEVEAEEDQAKEVFRRLENNWAFIKDDLISGHYGD